MTLAERMAETLQRRYPDPDDYPFRSWCYAQGFMLWGFIRLYEKTGEDRYRDYVLRYCDEHVSDEGEIRGYSGISLDDIMAGSVLVWAWQQTQEERYRTACRRIRHAFDDYPRNPDGGFWHGRHLNGEMWVDGLFMGLQFLARFGVVIEDREYCLTEAVRQLKIVFARCEKDGTGLLYHAYSARRGTPWAHAVSGRSHEVWSEGLGWYAMVLVDVLGMLPKDFPGYDDLHMQMEKLFAALARVQDDLSGLWFQVVDKVRDPGNWHDTSGSAMFLYAFRKAQLLGLTEPGLYDKVITRAYEGVKTKCIPDMDGNINVHDACAGLGVQMNYDAYIRYTRNINAQEAVAAVLWASVAMDFEGI